MPPTPAAPPRLVTLFFLTGLVTLSLNMFLPSLSLMADGFGVPYGLISLALGIYMASTAVLQLIIGPLSDRFGRRPVLLAGLAVFTVASVGCALTSDISLFLSFRALQGAVISCWVLAMAAVRDTHDQKRGASLIGYISGAMAVAPMVGPMIGGALAELFGWRSNFLLYVILGGGLLIWCWMDFHETNLARSKTLSHQLRQYPNLLRSARFWGYTICMGSSTGGFYVFLAGAPLVAVTVFDLAIVHLGIALGATTVGYMTGSFLSGRYSMRTTPTTMIILGRLVACAGLVAGLTCLLLDIVRVELFFGATIFFGIGNGLTMPSASMGAVSVEPRLIGSAAGLSGALGMAIGAALTPLAGYLVAGPNAAIIVLSLMLATAIVGLTSILAVRRMDRMV